jgi:hypothetical protein
MLRGRGGGPENESDLEGSGQCKQPGLTDMAPTPSPGGVQEQLLQGGPKSRGVPRGREVVQGA